jgi:hypothetical protein
MKVYVLMYDCSQYEGVFSSIEKAVEFIKSQHNDDFKITRVEQVYGHYHEVYTERTYTDWDTNEEVIDEINPYTIIEEELDATKFYATT